MCRVESYMLSLMLQSLLEVEDSKIFKWILPESGGGKVIRSWGSAHGTRVWTCVIVVGLASHPPIGSAYGL